MFEKKDFLQSGRPIGAGLPETAREALDTPLLTAPRGVSNIISGHAALSRFSWLQHLVNSIRQILPKLSPGTMKLLVRALLHADRFHQPQYAPDYATSTLDGNMIEDKISRFLFADILDQVMARRLEKSFTYPH